VHSAPALHGQLPAAVAAGGATHALLPGALQTFFDALTEPSLQTNRPAAQCETPPLRPEHGVLPASATALAIMHAASSSQAIPTRRP
jgi:hypothetical protein